MVYLIPTYQAERLANQFKNEFCVVYPDLTEDRTRKHRDGELYLNIQNVRDLRGDAVVLHTGAPDQHASYMDLKFTLQLLRQKSRLRRIDICSTYFMYARQDCDFQDGEINIAEALVHELTTPKRKGGYADGLYILDPHFGNRPWVWGYPVTCISTYPLFYEHIHKLYPHVEIVAPDGGAARRNSDTKKMDNLFKKRKGSHVTCSDKKGKLQKYQGRKIGFLDDIIYSGGTILDAEREMASIGANVQYYAATHGVLQKGLERLLGGSDGKVKDIFVTNSILHAQHYLEKLLSPQSGESATTVNITIAQKLHVIDVVPYLKQILLECPKPSAQRYKFKVYFATGVLNSLLSAFKKKGQESPSESKPGVATS